MNHPSRRISVALHNLVLPVLPVLPALLALLAVTVTACEKTPPEPEKREPAAPPPAASSAELHASTPPAAPKGDPLEGKFTLADATKDITGTGALIATIDTSEGALRCKLLEDKAPVTVANFVGLAQGTRPWKDSSGQWVSKPAYDGTTFHRVIKGFMIQGGDPKGNGTGEPGYVIPDEKWAGGKHDRAGLLCMANRGPNTNGAQFFITDEAASHLDVSYTIFGECSPVDTVHKIASVKVRGETPETPVRITSVKVAREKPGAGAKGDKADKGDAGAKH
ncbi:peptidylprolyl isomerase [Pendulispora albinea]|uniref:Peptidyl-prolyl cis-trans isomerase n=1 Tax=Pendulispora albinea TaxID=2741071 RepID=A0ABZ2M2Y9_9BACT